MQCIFSGKETNSAEHVIPSWLQKRMNLTNRRVIIPNGTELKYKHLKVPALDSHNNNFGKIETKISQNKFDKDELYLWALKIHIGFIYKNSNLRFNIKNPSSGFILNIGDFESEINLFQWLYKNWSKGGTTDPSPFGSVYILDSLTPSDQFDFFHCMATGTVGIDIGDKFIIVFLWDQNDSQNTNVIDSWNNYHIPLVQKSKSLPTYSDHCYLAPHIWAYESAYLMYRYRRTFTFLSTDNKIILTPPTFRNEPKEYNEDVQKKIAKSFGLKINGKNQNGSNLYSPLEIFLK